MRGGGLKNIQIMGEDAFWGIIRVKFKILTHNFSAPKEFRGVILVSRDAESMRA